MISPSMVVGSLLLTTASVTVMAQQAAQESTVYDTEIRVVHAEKLDYPALPRLARIQGIVVVRAELDDKENVVTSKAVSGHKLLVEACLPNALKWRFEPRTREVIIIYDFGYGDWACGWDGSPCRSEFTLRPPNIATIRGGNQLVDHGG